MATGKDVGVGEGLGFEASSAPATREMTDGTEADEEVLLGFTAGVKGGAPGVEVAGGCPTERRLLGVLLDPLRERVVVVL